MSEAHEVAEALAARAEIVAASLLGQPTNVTHAEWRWGRRGSLSLVIEGQRRGLWFDHERGIGGDMLDLVSDRLEKNLCEAVHIARSEFLCSTPTPLSKSKNALKRCDNAEQGIMFALSQWADTVPLRGSVGERYFAHHRKLDIKLLGDLVRTFRWQARTNAIFAQARTNAIFALMTDPVTQKPCGVHRTFLKGDGSKLTRKMLGRQGVIRLSPDDEVTHGLGIVEGIEDGMAVLSCGWHPVWVVTSAGAIARLPVLRGIEALTIFADGDVAGLQAARACAARWEYAGREAHVLPPLVRKS
jgi:hypothetical protein